MRDNATLAVHLLHTQAHAPSSSDDYEESSASIGKVAEEGLLLGSYSFSDDARGVKAGSGGGSGINHYATRNSIQPLSACANKAGASEVR